MNPEKDFSPLTPSIVRALNDKLYEKRKVAALEIEKLVREFVAQNSAAQIKHVIQTLSVEFALSQHPHSRKGGLIGLAACSIALGKDSGLYLKELIEPVLTCFGDVDSRLRYYACEALYNIVKVARGAIVPHFNVLFDGLSKLAADPDPNVKSGSELLDRLLKDIVTESSRFDLVSFIPLLRERIYSNNQHARQFIISWILVLESVPDINLLDYLPEILDGLFQILGDNSKEIRKICEVALGEFLKEIKRTPANVKFAEMANILVIHCQASDDLIQLTAMCWMREFIQLAGRVMLPYSSGILTAVLPCLSYDDRKKNIKESAAVCNQSLMKLVTPEDDEVDEGRELLPSPQREVGQEEAGPKAEQPPSGGESCFPNPGIARRFLLYLSHLEFWNGFAFPRIPYLNMAQAEAGCCPEWPALHPSITAARAVPDAADAKGVLQRVTPSEFIGLLGLRLVALQALPMSLAMASSAEGTCLCLADEAAMVLEVPGKAAAWMSPVNRISIAPASLYQLDPWSRSLCQPAESHVILKDLEVLAEIASSPAGQTEGRGPQEGPGLRLEQLDLTVPTSAKSSQAVSSSGAKSMGCSPSAPTMNSYFYQFMINLLKRFSSERKLLETRGAFIIRQLCLLLNAENIFHSMADILLREEDLRFASTMVHTLNTILLTSSELFQLRNQLKDLKTAESRNLFCCLYRSWCHNPVTTVSLCFLTQNYKHAYDLIQKFGDLEVTVDFLIEVDKLVQLIECPIFTCEFPSCMILLGNVLVPLLFLPAQKQLQSYDHRGHACPGFLPDLRLQLLDVKSNPYLLKALYGLLMLLPQSNAFQLLSHRLQCVPNPELMQTADSAKAGQSARKTAAGPAIDYAELLQHFERVQGKHLQGRHQRATRAGEPPERRGAAAF
ncbi:hypothetical protein Chor_013288 [Crotalus horridus]